MEAAIRVKGSDAGTVEGASLTQLSTVGISDFHGRYI